MKVNVLVYTILYELLFAIDFFVWFFSDYGLYEKIIYSVFSLCLFFFLLFLEIKCDNKKNINEVSNEK